MIDFLRLINEGFTLFFVFPGIILLGIYLTWRLRSVQVTKMKMSFASLISKDEGGEGNISHYQAIAAVLASNFGTGNISGMAVALSVGGPGALMWMWVMAFLGTAIQYASCLLGVKYRKKNANGEYIGGPMHYLADGLKWKKLAITFSVLVLLGAFTCGSFVQVNSIALPLEKLGLSPWISGIGLAILVGIVVLGGAQRVAVVSSAVVPVMALLYLGAAFIILGIHYDQLLPSLVLIGKSAFGGWSLVGGALGYGVLKALTTGFNRAIFATDAGTGTTPMLQSGARTRNPVIDGVVTLSAPLLVMIVCSATALVLMVTGAWQMTDMQSTNMVTYAFQKDLGMSIGGFVVIISLFLFGYTTTIAWATCLERAVEFLFGRRYVRAFNWLYIIMVPAGAILHVGIVWILADLVLTAMLLINVLGVAGLSKEVIQDTREFFFSKKEAAIALEEMDAE